VSAPPSALLAEWNRVRKSLAVICVSHEELDQFFSSTFDQLEALSAELARRQQTFVAERQEAQRDLARRAAMLDQQQAVLETQSQRLFEQAQHPAAHPDAVSPEKQQQFEQLLAETAQHREELRNAQASVEAQTASLAELSDRLLQAQKDLVAAQTEIQQQRRELDAARAQPSPTTGQTELEQRLREMEQERTLLEAELETVRGRAAELAETLAQQQRQMADDRAHWTEELQYLRRLLERLTPPNAERETVAVAATTVERPRNNGRSEAPAAVGANDPVLDSVMAQFTLLQKDLAQRRKVTSPSE
jgi:chromosome segregation ATPase